MSNKTNKRIRKLTQGFTPAQLKEVKRKYTKLPHSQKGFVLEKMEELQKANNL
jgi:hypothetical protein